MADERCETHGGDCYAIWLNKAGDGKRVYSLHVCQKCGAHLHVSGICLNACHLSDASRERFDRLLALVSQEARRG